MDIQFIRSFGKLELLAKQAIEGFMTGLHKSPYHGFSVEFAEHKQYNAGESTKHIDWKAFAKTDRLYTKFYEEETNLRCQFLIDTSSSMYYPKKNYGKITYAAYACAALSYLLHKQRDAIGLTLFNEKITKEIPIKGTGAHLQLVFSILQDLINKPNIQKSTTIPKTLHHIAEKKYKRNLIILFTDLLSNKNQMHDFLHALQHLKHKNHEVIIFHIFDEKTERNLELENKPHRITDLESGEKIDLNPEQIKENYQKEISKYFHNIKILCGNYKIDFIEIDINKPLNDLLLAYLTKRKKM